MLFERYSIERTILDVYSSFITETLPKSRKKIYITHLR
jgi:hypothetical protein